jgi:hypothetical protein
MVSGISGRGYRHSCRCRQSGGVAFGCLHRDEVGGLGFVLQFFDFAVEAGRECVSANDCEFRVCGGSGSTTVVLGCRGGFCFSALAFG